MSGPGNPNSGHSAYGRASEKSFSQREKEGQLLMKAAGSMQELVENWDHVRREDVEVVVEYKRNLWSLFYNAATEQNNDKPVAEKPPVERTIIQLSDFVFQRSLQILRQDSVENCKPLFEVLININKQIASGLFKSTQR